MGRPPVLLVMEDIELSCGGVVDELSVELVADGRGEVELRACLVDLLSVLGRLFDGIDPLPAVLVVNGEFELCASVVDELFVGLVNGIFPPLVLLGKGGVKLCVSVIEELLVELVDSDFPLL